MTKYSIENVVLKRASKSIYRDGNFCIKLFESAYPKSDIFNEALMQARVEETGLNIPKIIEVTKIGGKWAIVLDYIEGQTLEELIKKNPQKSGYYLERFVELQLEMHSKSCPKLGKLRDKMNRKISASGLDATSRYELHHSVDAMPKHNKLCHGDYNLSNVILTKDNQLFILDWGHATEGNASADAARAYQLLKIEGQDKLAEEYLKLFCAKSDTAKQYVQKWMPIVAAAHYSKAQGKEKEILFRWANVMDYE